MLPDSDEGGDAVLAVVEEDDPGRWLADAVAETGGRGCGKEKKRAKRRRRKEKKRKQKNNDIHSVGVHGLANKELVVLEVGNDLLGVGRGAGLKGLDVLVAGTLGLHGLLDLLHVGLEVGEVRLLVELGLIETERVDDIDDGLGLVVVVLGSVLSRGVGANVCRQVVLEVWSLFVFFFSFPFLFFFSSVVQFNDRHHVPMFSAPTVILPQSAS